MGKQLGQGDIDALFAAAGANASAQSAGQASEAPLERYDFSRAGQISNDQMRAISSVNDLFARNLMHTLGAWLRTPFKMKLVAGEQLPFSEFLERLSSPSYICSIRLEPLGAVGLLELELALASPIVDVLLGGVGRAWPTRELTEIEEAILTSVVQMAVQELNLAWQSVGLEFVFEKRETERGGSADVDRRREDVVRELRGANAGGAGGDESVFARGSTECDSAAVDL